MKNRSGLIIGFVLGAAGFLLLFKLFVLEHISPSDEIAPGAVLIAAIFSGVLLAWAGNLIQGYLQKRKVQL